MQKNVLLSTFVTAALALGLPDAASAQGPQVEIVPYLGAYAPTSNLVDMEGAVFVDGILVNVSLEGKQKTSIALGGRVAVWLTDALGLEGAFGFAPSGAKGEVVVTDGTFTGFIADDAGGSAWTLSAWFNYCI